MTLTNFCGSLGLLTEDYYVEGFAVLSNVKGLVFSASKPSALPFPRVQVPADGSLVLQVWEVTPTGQDTFKDARPFTGSVTVAAGDLYIDEGSTPTNYDFGYVNNTNITFTNGNASIDFATQMYYAP